MKFSRNLTFHTRRDAWVEIDLNAIEQNTLAVREFVPADVRLMAVVKADAYGHGTVMILPTLEASGISMLGVAAMDEAMQIRQAGLTMPILVLGATPDWAMQYAPENDVEMTVFSYRHLDALARLNEAHPEATFRVHIKVDTGMHRIGVPWQEAAAFITHCQSLPYLQVNGVFSHLASADNADFTQTQRQRWQHVIENLHQKPPLLHLTNSSGTWHYPLDHVNMIRTGISVYGYPGDHLPIPATLKPAMGLKARIVHLQDLLPGEGVSYGQTYINASEKPRRIATLPLGYADGIPRRLSNHISGIYQGKRIPQVGTISMDQLMMDVTDIPDAAVGDVITLLGESNGQRITLTEWATVLDTIEYELMCALRIRLPKTYVRT